MASRPSRTRLHSPARRSRSGGTPRSSMVKRRRQACTRRPTPKVEHGSPSRCRPVCLARCSCSSRSGTASTRAHGSFRLPEAPPDPSSSTPRTRAWCRRAPSRPGYASSGRRASRSPERASWSRCSKAASRGTARPSGPIAAASSWHACPSRASTSRCGSGRCARKPRHPESRRPTSRSRHARSSRGHVVPRSQSEDTSPEIRRAKLR